jgi:hypothetical protein
MQRILDCASGHLDGAAVRAAGFDGAIRYLKKEGSSLVVPIDARERLSLLAAGRSVAYVYQHVQSGSKWGSLSRVTQGRDAGFHDAQWALTQLTSVGGQLRAIYGVTCDYDVPPSDIPGIIEYARGWCDVLGKLRVGVYGKDTVLHALKNAGVASWFWQTTAWSGGRTFPGRHLFQKVGYVSVGGVQCDVNECSGSDWGQEVAEEDDMAMDQTQFNKMMDAYYDSQVSPFNSSLNLKSATFAGAQWAGEGLNQAKANGEALTTNQQVVLAAIAEDNNQVDMTSEQVQLLLNGLTDRTKQAFKDALREGTG